MTRTLKLIGLSALAMLALTAMAASAQAKLFHAEEAPVFVTGEQEESSSFTSHAGTITCKKGHFEGSSETATTETLTITPSYSECTFLGVVGVAVNMNGCDYLFNANGHVSVSGTNCAAAPISFSALGCTVTIGPQTLTEAVYTNKGEGTTRDVTVTPNVAGITHTTSALCPGGAGTFNTGVYDNGRATVKGFNEFGIQQGIWVE